MSDDRLIVALDVPNLVQALELTGMEPMQAARAVALFKDHDEKLMDEHLVMVASRPDHAGPGLLQPGRLEPSVVETAHRKILLVVRVELACEVQADLVDETAQPVGHWRPRTGTCMGRQTAVRISFDWPSG